MKKEEFRNLLFQKLLILDGATGTQLQKLGYMHGVSTAEELNIKYPDRIREVHASYLSAGSDIIFSNTFGANKLKLAHYNLENKMEEIIERGVLIAKQEAGKTNSFVAGDISSLGSYLQPLGPISVDLAYENFRQQALLLKQAGVDLIVIETMTEIKELKAAILATKDVYSGPIMVQMTFSYDGASVTGTDILSFIAMAESLNVDAIGMNCSVGPGELLKLAKLMAENTNLPISFKPNAGMPQLINRETVFPGTKEEFVQVAIEAYKSGINMIGGCCGTTPEFISLLSKELKNKKPITRKSVNHHLLSTRTKAVDLNLLQKPIIIGERINPTGRKIFQAELSRNIFSLVKQEARVQANNGANILDVNMGVPGADETALMIQAVNEVQEIVNIPLSLDSSFTDALLNACKHCAGKPLINSVNGETEKLESILPIVKRYGASVIALTVDENGIPKTWQKRLEIAEKILSFADKYSISHEEIIFDYLTLSASSSAEQAFETLQAIKISKEKFPECKTVLGVSNVSFGLPSRQTINSTFLKMALKAGLDIAICNPGENWTIDDEYARTLLENKDPNAKSYISKYSNVQKTQVLDNTKLSAQDKLFNSIINGDKDYVIPFTDEVLKETNNPMFISNEIILKALNIVGEKFNSKEFFLPQVILSAEVAQLAFSHIKPLIKKNIHNKTAKVVMATVKGDAHDIGKNIVTAVLESFGFDVLDLGKNVEAETIIEKAKEFDADIIGLSALMTTTMIEMEKVIELKNISNLKAKVIIGGAPVTKLFAQSINAEGYSKDAIEAANLIKTLLN
ncbi:MAG: homocysteine S-methyltransferase family protein [Endomicrobiaceae bacterium]|nr:homocysteine S-methyltransferase family protein [Endomicrobiaceae bacterium]